MTATMRTIRVFVDHYEPGLAWDEITGDDMSSGAYGDLLPDFNAAAEALAALRIAARDARVYEYTGMPWQGPGASVTMTAPADHPLIMVAA